MKLFLTILVAALAAFAARKAAAPAAGAAGDAPVAENAVSQQTLAELRAENQRLAAEVQRRESQPVAAHAPDQGVSETEIAAALERWQAAHPAEEQAAGAAGKGSARGRTPADLEIANVPMSELVRVLRDQGFGSTESQVLFQRLRDAGRIAEYVAAMEKLAAEDPENADLQVALGHAYLQQLFGVSSLPEAGPLAMKSDAAFERALEIDDQNWGARFSKAVSLTNWPAFLGKGPEAIEHFEILLEQQATLPKRDEFAATYLFLGNMLQSTGKPEEALATWRAGLEQFPDVEELKNAVALATRTSDRPDR